MTSSGVFILKQLLGIRVFVVFIAPGQQSQTALNDWPQVWVCDDNGVWDQLRFGRQHRAHELLCLLAWSKHGVRQKDVDLYFAQVPDDDGEVVREAKHNAAKRARITLEARLEQRGLEHLFARSREDAWSLDAVISDVELAAAAVRQGEWETASQLVDGGDGCVVGLARLARGRRRTFGLRVRPTRRDAARTRLPRELLATATTVADAVRTSAAHARQAPPKSEHWIESVMAWLSEPTQRVAPTPTSDVTEASVDADHADEPIVDAEVVASDFLQAGEDDDEQASEDRRPLPVPVASRALVGPDDPSVVEELIDRAPIPETKPATLGQLSSETTLPLADGALEVPVHPLRGQDRRPRRAVGVLGSLVIALAAAAVILLLLLLLLLLLARRSSDTSAGETAEHGRLEQESPAHSVKTFADPRDLSANTVPLPANRVVLVSCRTYVPSASSNTGGYWYRLASSRWHGRYAPANTFLNGDPGAAYYEPNAPKIKDPHDYDTAVPVCSDSQPGGSLETPRARTTPTFASASRGAPAGPALTSRARVLVSCKLASDTPTAQPGGFVYRISSSPWSDHYYAPSRAFRNTVPADSSDLQLDDVDVPSCPK